MKCDPTFDLESCLKEDMLYQRARAWAQRVRECLPPLLPDFPEGAPFDLEAALQEVKPGWQWVSNLDGTGYSKLVGFGGVVLGTACCTRSLSYAYEACTGEPFWLSRRFQSLDQARVWLEAQHRSRASS